LADEPLDGGDVGASSAVMRVKASPTASRAAGAADAVDIILGMLRHVVVDDVADVGDVDAARGDVGGDHDLVLAVAKTFQRLFAVRAACGWSGARRRRGCALELCGDAVGGVLGAAKISTES
jgi:hypothetical protein